MDQENKIIIDDTAKPIAPVNGAVILELKHPFDIEFKSDGKTESVRSLTIRRIKGHDMMAINKIKDEMTQTITLFCRLTGQSQAVFEQLDGEDVEAFAKVVENFMPASQETGKK